MFALTNISFQFERSYQPWFFMWCQANSLCFKSVYHYAMVLKKTNPLKLAWFISGGYQQISLLAEQKKYSFTLGQKS